MSIIPFPNTNKEGATNAAPRFIRPMPLNIASEPFKNELPKPKKTAPDPLKNYSDIENVMKHLVSNGRYRDNLLFVMGINFGLRCGDLLKMRVGHILSSENTFNAEIRIEEEKTKKKKNLEDPDAKEKPGKIRTCYMNKAVMDAAELYLTSLKTEINLNDYLFKSMSNNNSRAYYDTLKTLSTSKGNPISIERDVDASITVKSVERMLKETINEELGIDVHAGTHLLRKTFAYHVLISAPDRTRALEFLMKTLGHSSTSVTLSYVGITQQEIMETCQNLNLAAGSKDVCYASGLLFEPHAG